MEHELGQLILGVGRVEGVLAVLEHRLVRVHSRAIGAEDRLGHERGVQSVRHRDVPHDELECHQVVCGPKRLSILEVDFVLAFRHLVVRRLDLESHRFEIGHDVSARALSEIDRCEIEVPARVMGHGGGASILISLEQEELCLDACGQRVSHGCGSLDHPFEAPARVAHKSVAIGAVDIAEDLGHAGFRVPPGEDAKRLEVGPEEHVTFFDLHEPFDRRAVEQNLAVERLGELTRRHLDVFRHAEDVDEDQTEETDVECSAQRQEPVAARRREILPIAFVASLLIVLRRSGEDGVRRHATST